MAAAVAFAGPAVAQAGPAAPKRPNIVVFLADDMGYRDTTPWGDRIARTPNLDRLAADGLAFDRAFVSSPACAPSRASLLTGLMPARSGAKSNHDRADPAVRKLPSYLQALGYQVVAFGKVAHYQHTGTYGFDHYAHDTYHDDAAVPDAVAWLKARKDPRPLALFVGSNWPHVPWPVSGDGFDDRITSLPAKSVDTPETRRARARYYAAVARLDLELGDTMAAVDAVLGRDTFVLFSSDHGAQWPFGKWNLYDTGTRVPTIVRWRGRVAGGTRTDAMVSWVDFLPTLTEVAGGAAPTGIDGRSFAPLLNGRGGWKGRSEIFTTHDNDGNFNVYPMRSVRTDRWKYIRNLTPQNVFTTHIDIAARRGDPAAYFPTWRQAAETDPAARAIVDRYYRRPAEELYDLAADADEQRNVAGDPANAAVLKDLRARLTRWQAAQGDSGRAAGTPRTQLPPLYRTDPAGKED